MMMMIPNIPTLPPKPSKFKPGPFDVICARGKQAYNHDGNKYFRGIVSNATEKYSKVESKLQRSMIVTDIVDAIREKGGFLRMNDTTGEWIECSDVVCREKVGQCFRSALGCPAKYKDVELKLIDYINNQRRRRATILAHAFSDGNEEQYEEYLYLNIEENNEEYEELTWNTLTKKGLQFAKELGYKDGSFKASQNWLRKMMKRYGIVYANIGNNDGIVFTTPIADAVADNINNNSNHHHYAEEEETVKINNNTNDIIPVAVAGREEEDAEDFVTAAFASASASASASAGCACNERSSSNNSNSTHTDGRKMIVTKKVHTTTTNITFIRTNEYTGDELSLSVTSSEVATFENGKELLLYCSDEDIDEEGVFDLHDDDYNLVHKEKTHVLQFEFIGFHVRFFLKRFKQTTIQDILMDGIGIGTTTGTTTGTGSNNNNDNSNPTVIIRVTVVQKPHFGRSGENSGARSKRNRILLNEDNSD